MVILPTPFVLAELLRSLRERRVDRGRWAGLVFSGLVAAAVFLGVLGLAHYRVFGGVFYREIVEGLKLRDESVRELSARLGMSESAVKVTAHRGYQALKKLLGVKPS